VGVRMVVDAAGRVVDVRARDAKDKARVAALRSRVVGVALVSGNPDKATFKLTRGGCWSGWMSSAAGSLLVTWRERRHRSNNWWARDSSIRFGKN